MPKTTTLKDFRQGIDSNIYKDSAIARIEHFDTINGQLRQNTAPLASTSVAYGSDISLNALNSFAVIGSTLYALGFDSSASHPAIFRWNYSNQYWEGLVTFGAGATARGLVSYSPDSGTTTYLYGLYNSTNIFRATVGGAIAPTHASLSYTNYANPFVHSKDNRIYFFTDNIVSSFNGTTVTTGLTLPANFRITCACEDGDYILIAGYNTNGVATGYLWDRDSSLTTVTAKYDLGRDIPKAVARIGGNTFFVSHRQDSSFTNWSDQSVLVVRLRNGDRADIISEYQMPTLGVANNSYFITANALYFMAYAKLRNDTSAKNLVFCLNYDGKLSIAVNMGVDSSTTNPKGVGGLFRDGDGWWVAGSSDGSWNSANTYTTTSLLETNIIRADSFLDNIKLLGAWITCESLPSGASIVLKARKDAETSWTPLKTFSTATGTKFAIKDIDISNGLNKLGSGVKQFQLQLVATGISASPVIITGFTYVTETLIHDNNAT